MGIDDPTPVDEPPRRERGPLTIAEGVRASEARRSATERDALEQRDIRQDKRTDDAWQIVVGSLRNQLRFAALIVALLIAAVLVLAGHAVGIDIPGVGQFSGGETEASD
jgi:hypothetical protein